MKTKVVLFAAAGLLSVGVGFHVAGTCPLRQMMAHTAKHQAAPVNPVATDAKASLVKAR